MGISQLFFCRFRKLPVENTEQCQIGGLSYLNGLGRGTGSSSAESDTLSVVDRWRYPLAWRPLGLPHLRLPLQLGLLALGEDRFQELEDQVGESIGIEFVEFEGCTGWASGDSGIDQLYGSGLIEVERHRLVRDRRLSG